MWQTDFFSNILPQSQSFLNFNQSEFHTLNVKNVFLTFILVLLSPKSNHRRSGLKLNFFNMQNCSCGAGTKRPTEGTEHEKAPMFLSFIGILDEQAKFPIKCCFPLINH